MLFHTFRVVYTVKELYSHANHGQSLKKLFMCIYVPKSHFRFVQVSGKCFFRSWLLLT